MAASTDAFPSDVPLVPSFALFPLHHAARSASLLKSVEAPTPEPLDEYPDPKRLACSGALQRGRSSAGSSAAAAAPRMQVAGSLQPLDFEGNSQQSARSVVGAYREAGVWFRGWDSQQSVLDAAV